MHYNRLPFLSLILFFLFSCSTPIDRLSFVKDVKAKSILEKAIKGSGGWEAWDQQRHFAFKKEYALYLENGEVETSAIQQHEYNFKQPWIANISWEKEGDEHIITYAKGEAIKWKNEQRDTAFAAQRALNIVLSSTFVMRLPYNLEDPTAKIEYEGEDEVKIGEKTYPVEVVQVTYDPANNDNHTTPDVWELYFDKGTGVLHGYQVQHKDHLSFVENLATQKVNGLLMPLQRKSWRMNEDGSKQYLRADYKYSYDDVSLRSTQQ